MNGVHDLGGVDGFGPVQVEPAEPVFHADWERRVFGMTAVMSGQLRNVHRFRHAIERMRPEHYLGSPYYEHWLTALATLMTETGAIAADELQARSCGGFALSRPVHVQVAMPADASASEPRFVVGDAVRVRNIQPFGHTRCPRYVRGKRGEIVRIDGRHALPDVAAHGGPRCKQFQYCVRFGAAELWGAAAGGGESFHVDLWESYLEPA